MPSLYILKRKPHEGTWRNTYFGVGGIKRGRWVTHSKHSTLEQARAVFNKQRLVGLDKWAVFHQGKIILD